MDLGVKALLAWLAGFGAVSYALWASGRGKMGRLSVYPLALILRLGITIEGGQASPRWKLVSRASWLGVALMAFAIATFYFGVINLVYQRYIARALPAGEAPIVPFIPGVTIAWSDMPVIGAALGIAVIVHEAAHAIAARAEGLKVKNAGLALIAFIPAAFVEVDEDEFRKAPLRVKAKVYSAGVAANIILAFAVGYLLSGLAYGAMIVDVAPDSPAAAAGLQTGDVIVSVNGTKVNDVGELSSVLRSLGVGDPNSSVTLELEVLRGEDEIVLVVEKPEGVERIGIVIVTAIAGPASLLYALWMINYALALINAAPLFVTDGGQLLRETLYALAGRAGFAVSMGIQASTLILVASLIGISRITLPY